MFDIDVTDYKEVILEKEQTELMTSLTWYLCATAIQVVDSILRDDFGFGKKTLFPTNCQNTSCGFLAVAVECMPGFVMNVPGSSIIRAELLLQTTFKS